ncbi:MAG: hypothetical protein IK086_03150 [Clostridia bacterium]|nr:hypothetical protein [Clostridia bacterium]
MKLKLPFKTSITRIFANNKFVVAFSLILSFVIWLSVVINENPVRERVFTNVKINVSVENTTPSSLGLGIISNVTSKNFVVTVSGPNYIVSSLSEDDFVLSADVSEITSPGTYPLTVYCNRSSSKSGYDFKSVSPATIDVKFDYIDSKEFTIIPKLIGVSAASGLVAETPVVANSEQSTITVKGPRETVEKIGYVESYAEVNKTLSSTETFTSYVALYTEDDKVIYKYLSDGTVVNGSGKTIANTYLTLSYTSLKVTQPISKKAYLAVKPTFVNVPDGITADSIKYTVDQKKANVIGPPAVVGEMSSITLAPIDFRNVSSTSNSFDVTPTLKDGVKLLDSIDHFTVTLDMSEYTEKSFVVSKTVYEGVDSSMKASSSPLFNVKICGPKNIISSLKSTDLYAVADLSDKTTTGDFSVNVTVKSDKYNTVWQVGNYPVTVTLK